MNKDIHKAFAVLAKNPKVRDLPSFWCAFGRSDLAVYTRYEQLAGAPTLQSVLYEATREIARRIEADKPSEYVEIDGKQFEVKRSPKNTRPAPLTNFLLSGNNYGDGRASYFERRRTKGWRWAIVDDSEAKLFIKQGVKLFDELPQEQIRKRRVA